MAEEEPDVKEEKPKTPSDPAAATAKVARDGPSDKPAPGDAATPELSPEQPFPKAMAPAKSADKPPVR